MEPRTSFTYNILRDIRAHPQSSYIERARRVRCSHPWMFRVIAYLEERKQVMRKKSNNPTKADILYLSQKGERALQALELYMRLIRK